jgi:DNA-binding beta-propeller fold protein YncE
MRAARELNDFRTAEERGAEQRAWGVVQLAYRAGEHRRVRRTRRYGRPALALALALVAGALMLSPAGATVGQWIKRTLDLPHGAHGLSSRAPSQLLVSARQPPAAPQALLTAETENRLLVVDLPSGRVAHEVPLPPDPEDIATTAPNGGLAIVVSSRAGEVTVFNLSTLRILKTFAGFDEPHIVAVSPDGQHAYVTDDNRGTLTAIRLSDMTVTATIRVGQGAHHIAFSPDQHRAWVALGESADQISILNTTDVDHPIVVGHFSPGFPAHDLAFSPSGRQIWITSSASPFVTAFNARDHRVLFRIPAGAPPQHVVFEGPYAYLSSGYSSQIEQVNATTGKVLARASAPYGSFELAAADGYVVTSSLLRGTLAVYTTALKPVRVVTEAPETREVAITRP